jgi:hypothetical protein
MVTTEEVRVGMSVRRAGSNHEFQTVTAVWPQGRGARVEFEGGTSATVGRGAEWEVEA